MNIGNFLKIFSTIATPLPEEIRFESLPEDATEDDVIAEVETRFRFQRCVKFEHVAMGELCEHLTKLGHTIITDGELLTGHRRFTKGGA